VTRSLRAAALALAAAASSSSIAQEEAVSPAMERAGQLYVICGACHGAHAQGERSLQTPALAGQQPDYLLRQLKLFASGARGGAGDPQGQQMQQILQTISGEQDWASLVAYINTLPVKGSTPQGEAARGKELYQTCAGCHGAAGEGIAALNAPRLSILADWYIAEQLKKFKAGQRGSRTDDAPGMQMRAASGMLQSDADIEAVAAYIGVSEVR
jgi:cytochrome c oxidase subunit 2